MHLFIAIFMYFAKHPIPVVKCMPPNVEFIPQIWRRCLFDKTGIFGSIRLTSCATRDKIKHFKIKKADLPKFCFKRLQTPLFDAHSEVSRCLTEKPNR